MKISPILPKSNIRLNRNFIKKKKFASIPDSFSLSFKGDEENKPKLNPSRLASLTYDGIIDAEGLKKELDSGLFDINTIIDNKYRKSCEGQTLLETFIKRRLDLADILVERDDVDINLQNSEGQSALMTAIAHKKNDFAKKLLMRKDIDINLEDKEHLDALAYAIQENNDEMFDILAKRDDINICQHKEDGYTPAFNRALDCKRPDYALTLLKRKDFSKKMKGVYNAHDALVMAGRNNWIKLAKEIIRREDYNPNDCFRASITDIVYRTDLMLAIEERWSDKIIDELLNRCDIDVTNENPNHESALGFAKISGRQELIEKISKRKLLGVAPYRRLNPSELLRVMQGNDIEEFKRRLDSGQYDINAPFDDGYGTVFKDETLLNTAIFLDKLDFADILLERKDIDVNLQDIKGRTPLMAVISHESEDSQRCNELAKKLLERDDVDLNLEDKKKRTALYYAVECANDEIFDILIQRPDVDVNRYLGSVLNPFGRALKLEYPDYALKILKRKDFAKNSKGRFDANLPLDKAIEKNWIELAKELIRREDYYPNRRYGDSSRDLIYAIKMGREEIIDELLNRSDIDVSIKDYGGNDAIKYAFSKKRYAIAFKILKRKFQGITLHKRLPQSETPLLDKPMQTGFSQEKEDEASKTFLELYTLMKDNNIEGFKQKLQDSKFDINMRFDNYFLKSRDGYTLLEWAIALDKIDFVDVLLKRDDIDINLQNRAGHTPLMLAIDAKANEIAKRFLKRDDIDVNFEDINGLTAISHAIIKHNDEMFYILEQRDDVDINHTTNRYYEGKNPFAQALRYNEPHYALKLAQRKDFARDDKKFDLNQALCLACASYDAHSVAYEILKQEDYNPNKLYCHYSKDSIKQTDLMFIYNSYSTRDGIIEELLRRSDIDLSVKDSKGRDILQYAIDNEDKNFMEKFSKRKLQGAAPYKRLPEGKAAIQEAKKEKIALTKEQLKLAQKLKESLLLEINLPADINQKRSSAKQDLTSLLSISPDFFSEVEFAKLAIFIEDDEIMEKFDTSISLLNLILTASDGKQVEDSKHDLLELNQKDKLPISREYDVLYNLFYYGDRLEGESMKEKVDFLAALSNFNGYHQMNFLDSHFPKILTPKQKNQIAQLSLKPNIMPAVKDGNLDILDFIVAIYQKPSVNREDFLESLAKKRQENLSSRKNLDFRKIDNALLFDMKKDLTLQKTREADILEYIAYERRQKVLEQMSKQGIMEGGTRLYENMDILF